MKKKHLILAAAIFFSSQAAFAQGACPKELPQTTIQEFTEHVKKSYGLFLAKDEPISPSCYPNRKDILFIGAPFCHFENNGEKIPVGLIAASAPSANEKIDMLVYMMRDTPNDTKNLVAYFDSLKENKRIKDLHSQSFIPNSELPIALWENQGIFTFIDKRNDTITPNEIGLSLFIGTKSRLEVLNKGINCKQNSPE